MCDSAISSPGSSLSTTRQSQPGQLHVPGVETGAPAEKAGGAAGNSDAAAGARGRQPAPLGEPTAGGAHRTGVQEGRRGPRWGRRVGRERWGRPPAEAAAAAAGRVGRAAVAAGRAADPGRGPAFGRARPRRQQGEGSAAGGG